MNNIFANCEVSIENEDDDLFASFYSLKDNEEMGGLLIHPNDKVSSTMMNFDAFDLNDKKIVSEFISWVRQLQ